MIDKTDLEELAGLINQATGIAIAAVIAHRPATTDDARALFERLFDALDASADLETKAVAWHMSEIIGGLTQFQVMEEGGASPR